MWQPSAPKLPTTAAAEPEVASPEPPAYGLEDEREPGEAVLPTS